MRDMSTGFQNEIEASSFRPAFLIEIDFDAAPLYLWTGIGTLSLNGKDYIGAGQVLEITPVRETQTVEAVGIRGTLSGVPSSLVAIALDEDYQQRPVVIYFAAIDSAGNVYTCPYFSGFADTMSISDGGQFSTITLSIESDLARLRDPVNRYQTPEDQKLDYPSDKFFDFVPTNADREIIWGRT